MGLRDITRTGILAAVAEYDKLGQDEFLRRYGFDRACADSGSPWRPASGEHGYQRLLRSPAAP